LAFLCAPTKLGAVDAQVLSARGIRWRRVAIVSALAAFIAVVALAIATFAWLRSYAPLEQGSTFGGLSKAEGKTVDPLDASGRVPVLFPRYRRGRTFHVVVALANRGRLGVTVLGLPKRSSEPAVLVPAKVRVGALNGGTVGFRPLDSHHPVRIEPGQEREVAITYRIAGTCIGGQPKRYWSGRAAGVGSITDVVSFRIRYARWFERSQTMQLPFAIDLVCVRGLVPAAG
jgi:hypothetical protein